MRSATCTVIGTTWSTCCGRPGWSTHAGDWSGDDATLWVLGDYVDRGPDGVGVIDVVMRLQQQAPQAGGRVGALMGNHEVLALGMHRFADAIVRDADGHEHAFTTSWALNGGRPSDQARLTPEHLAWLAALPAVARDGDWLLTHSDTTEYLDWGSSVAEVNARVAGVTAAGDLEAWWDLWRGSPPGSPSVAPGASPPPRR